MTMKRVLTAVALVFMSAIVGAQIVENFDGVTAPNLPGGWAAQTLIAGGAPFATVNTASQTAPNSVFSDDPGVISDQVLVSPAFAISSVTAFISFQHARDLESTFDGAVLEVAINGGGFQDILLTGATFGANGYNGTINASFSSPLASRQAWTGTSGAGPTFLLTTVNLPASANGQSWVFRFRRGTDSSVAGVGFWVDSFAVYTLGAQDMAVSLTGLPGTATVGVPYTGSFTCTNVGGVAASAGTLCSISGLPAGLSQGSCTISPSAAAWVAGNAVPVGAVVTCAVSGTPTTAGSPTITGTTGATGDGNAANDTASLSFVTASAVPTPIPTLSEWALIFLSGLIGLFGVAGVRRRRY